MRDPKKAKLFPEIQSPRRRRVVEAAIRSIAVDGIENLTFATIAQAMGSTASHVKYYFPQKEDVVRAAVHQMLATLQTHIIEKITAETNPRRALEAYVTGSIEILETNKDFWPLITLYFYYCSRDKQMRETNKAFRTTAHERISALLRDLGIRNARDLESLASYIFILVQTQGMEFIYDQTPGSLTRAKQTCLMRLSRALGAVLP